MISSCFWVISSLCVLGCDQEHRGTVKEVTSMPKEPAKIMVTADGEQSLAIRLPKGTTPEDVTGLRVELQADKVKDEEGFTVLFQADPSKGGTRPATIGVTTIFKPLKTGERYTAHLGAPPLEAWKKDGDTWSITIKPQLRAGHPDRRIPDVALSITEAAANIGKR